MMRPARRSVKRPLLLAAAMLSALYFFFGRGGPALYDPAQAALHARPADQSDGITHSVVVPCYHERENLRPLVTQVFAALREPRKAEIVLVDDNSQDGSEAEAATLRSEGHNVVMIVRTDGRGLSSAVLRGFEEARGQSLVVMDADLQHPPEAVQRLFDALDNPDTPFASGTRYGADVAMDSNWPLYRRIISWGARSLARPLTSASDPMTGFFGIRKDLFYKSSPINSSGFKIALELLLKAPIPSNGIAEVPYSFGTRKVGESKLSSKVMLRYVGQLYTLYWWSWGVFFPLAILVLGTTAVGLALFALQQADARFRLGWGLARWTVGPNGLQQRRKVKSEDQKAR